MYSGFRNTSFVAAPVPSATKNQSPSRQMKVRFNQASPDNPFINQFEQSPMNGKKYQPAQNYEGMTNFQSVLQARNSSPNSKLKQQQWALSESNDDVDPFEVSYLSRDTH